MGGKNESVPEESMRLIAETDDRARPDSRRRRLLARSLILCLGIAGIWSRAASGQSASPPPRSSASRGPGTASAARAGELLREGKPAEALPLLLETYRSSSGDFRVCHALGLAYTQLQEFDRAARFYREALRLKPDFIPARKNLGTVLWFSNRKADAEREFVSVAKTSPADPVPHLYLGLLQYERKKFERAKSHFERAGNFAFGNPEALPIVLETYLATGDPTFPDRVMKQVGEAATPNADLVFKCATLFGRYGFYPRAIDAFERIRSTYGDRYALMIGLGTAQLGDRRYRDAVETLESLSSGSTRAEVFLLLGEAYDKAGAPERAFAAYSRSIELEPKSEDGYIALSNFAAAHHNSAEAVKTLDRGLEAIPGSARLFLQRGTIRALELDFASAEESFRMAGKADPNATLPLLALGITQMQTGKLAEARETFRLAAGRDPADFRPEYFYASTLVRAGGQSDPIRRKEIVSSLRKAIVLNPRDAGSRVALGQTYLAADRLDLAAQEFRKALEIEPANSNALYQLSTVCRRQGRAEEAQRLLQMFQEVKAKAGQEEEQERKTLVQIMRIVGRKP
jgi:tetratricopeptide (TPR) repeat protein